jgi:hypothetical protein
MALPDTFRGHGTFIYAASTTTTKFGSEKKVAEAIADAHMTSAWVQVHTKNKSLANNKSTQKLVAALRDRGIGVAGWGWCQGADAKAEAKLAIRSLRDLGITDYVADIEEGVGDAHWTPAEIRTFFETLRGELPDNPVAVSTFPVITWHEPELMKAAAPYVDAFAPQAYWFWFPNQKLRNEFGTKYGADDPVAYVDLTIDNWRTITDKPLIITGASYWNESGMKEAEAAWKVARFVDRFTAWDRIAGLNWWHFGGNAMNAGMRDTITAARLDQKPYA